MKTPAHSLFSIAFAFTFGLATIGSISDSSALTRFDMNTDASATQEGWVAANLGTGSDGTISIATAALDGVTVTLDSRDRTGTASDAGGGAEAAMWNDFVFALSSFASNPGTGLQITITGLQPNMIYPLTLWAFDDASNAQADGFERAADWSDGNGQGGVLSFPNGPDPTTLRQYKLAFSSTSDTAGKIVLTGLVAAVNPSTSHNVFVNGLEIDSDDDIDGLPDSFEQQIIDADADDAIVAIGDVLPGDDFDADGLTNMQEFQAGTDPVDDDSDDDNFKDGVENGTGTWVSATETGTDPLNPDGDDDGLLDGVENHDLPYDALNPTTQPGSDPNLLDTDGDGFSDGKEVLVDGTDPTDPNDFFDPLAELIARFDFNNAGGTNTLAGWTAAELGNGSDGTVSVATVAVGAVTVDSRDRNALNTDAVGGDIENNDLWRDFVFANRSFSTEPGSGLQITLSGLAPLTTYPITIWAYDNESNNGRRADWGEMGEPAQVTLTFPSDPDPSSLDDYNVTFEASTDASGTVIIQGIVAIETPSASHNVFVNALGIGTATGSTAISITDVTYTPADNMLSLTWTSTPGQLYSIDLSPDLKSWPGDITDGVQADPVEGFTSYAFPIDGLDPRTFFRVRVLPNNN